MNKLYDANYYRSLQGEEAVLERLSGRLPMMNIAGRLFFVEVRNGQLRAKDSFEVTPINLDRGGYYNNRGGKELYCYDKRTMSEAKFPKNIKANLYHILNDKNIVVIHVPKDLELDPIAVAQLRGKKDLRYYLKWFPLVMYREAKVSPLTAYLLQQISGVKLPEKVVWEYDARLLATKNTYLPGKGLRQTKPAGVRSYGRSKKAPAVKPNGLKRRPRGV